MGKWMERGEARRAVAATVPAHAAANGEDSTLRAAARNDQTTKPAAVRTPGVDPLKAWRWRNAELLTDMDRRLGQDPSGFCADHHRWLSYPEQRRGACSWCVPVDPDREPEYWASHWRRFTAR